MAENWVKIGENTPLKSGDITRLTFKTWGGFWFKAIHAALIDRKYKNDPNFEILSTNYEQQHKIIIKVRVK